MGESSRFEEGSSEIPFDDWRYGAPESGLFAGQAERWGEKGEGTLENNQEANGWRREYLGELGINTTSVGLGQNVEAGSWERDGRFFNANMGVDIAISNEQEKEDGGQTKKRQPKMGLIKQETEVM